MEPAGKQERKKERRGPRWHKGICEGIRPYRIDMTKNKPMTGYRGWRKRKKYKINKLHLQTEGTGRGYGNAENSRSLKEG